MVLIHRPGKSKKHNTKTKAAAKKPKASEIITALRRDLREVEGQGSSLIDEVEAYEAFLQSVCEVVGIPKNSTPSLVAHHLQGLVAIAKAKAAQDKYVAILVKEAKAKREVIRAQSLIAEFYVNAKREDWDSKYIAELQASLKMAEAQYQMAIAATEAAKAIERASE